MEIESSREICKNLLSSSIPGSTSVLLIGSRARADFSPDSDYDIYLRMHWLAAILFYPKILAKSRELSGVLEAEVHISPLLTGRIRRRRDMLLRKARNEGRILCGLDFRREISTCSVTDMTTAELLIHSFSGGLFLLHAIHSWIQDGLESHQSRVAFHRSCAKAERYFRDLESLLEKPTEPSCQLPSDGSMQNRSEKRFQEEGGCQRTLGVAELETYWTECRGIFLSLLSQILAYDSELNLSSACEVRDRLNSVNRNRQIRERIMMLAYALVHRRFLALGQVTSSSISKVEEIIFSILASFEFDVENLQSAEPVSAKPIPFYLGERGLEKASNADIDYLINQVEAIWPVISVRF